LRTAAATEGANAFEHGTQKKKTKGPCENLAENQGGKGEGVLNCANSTELVKESWRGWVLLIFNRGGVGNLTARNEALRKGKELKEEEHGHQKRQRWRDGFVKPKRIVGF